MIRIRYIGAHLIARAFEHNFHRDHWDERHGLEPRQIDALAHNPQFEVEAPGKTAGSNGPITDGGTMLDAVQ